MKIHQLSLFLENKPGQMIQPCRVLADAGIGLHTLTLADTQQFGLLRLIVTDWEEGRKILEQAGYLVNVTEVVAVEVADRPGGLVCGDFCVQLTPSHTHVVLAEVPYRPDAANSTTWPRVES